MRKMIARVLKRFRMPARFLALEGDTLCLYVRGARVKHMPLWEMLLVPFHKMRKALDQLFAAYTLRVADRIVAAFGGELEAKTRRTQAVCLEQWQKRHTPIHDAFLAEVLARERNIFCERLLEKLRSESAAVFSENARRNIRELLEIVRQEEARRASLEEEDLKGISHRFALPSGTRFVFRSGYSVAYVVEQMPCVRTVRMYNMDHLFQRDMFRLAFPFVVFVIAIVEGSFFSMKVFVRNQVLKEDTDELFCPPLPNLHTQCTPCFPAPLGEKNENETVKEAIENFWASGFHRDYYSGYFEAAQRSFPELATLDRWEMESKRDPLFVLGINWEKTNLSVLRAAEKTLKYNRRQREEFETEEHVRRLADSVGEEMQEACLSLIPRGNVEMADYEAALQKIREVFQASRTELEKALLGDAGSVFAQENIEAVTRDAASEAFREMQSSAEEAIRDGEKAIEEWQKSLGEKEERHAPEGN